MKSTEAVIKKSIIILILICMAIICGCAYSGAKKEPHIKDEVLYDLKSDALQVWRDMAGSLESLTSYIEKHPKSGLTDDALFVVAKYKAANNENKAAIEIFDKIIRDYSDANKFSPTAPFADYGNPEEDATELAQYRQYVVNFPVKTSDLAIIEKARYSKSTGDVKAALSLYEQIVHKGLPEKQKVANRSSVLHLLIEFENPHEIALASLVALELDRDKKSKAQVYLHQMVDLYAGSELTTESVRCCIQFCAKKKLTEDENFWKKEKTRMFRVVEARMKKENITNSRLAWQLRILEKQ